MPDTSVYKVFLLNDEYTPMEFVVYVLERIFDLDRKDAQQLMLRIQTDGIAECGGFDAFKGRLAALPPALSRRFTLPPTGLRSGISYQCALVVWKGQRKSMSALGHKRTFRSAIAMSALTPESGYAVVFEECPPSANSGHHQPIRLTRPRDRGVSVAR